jgi:hypothetical protein
MSSHFIAFSIFNWNYTGFRYNGSNLGLYYHCTKYYGLDDRGYIPGEGNGGFFLFGSGAHPTSYVNCTVGKAAGV